MEVEMNHLFIDTEFSSFFSSDLSKSGELLQLACIPVIDGVRRDSFNEFCRPLTKTWSIEAEKVHGIRRDQALAAQHPSEMASKLMAFLQQYDCFFTPIGFNCASDESYINRLISDNKSILPYRKAVHYKWSDVLDKVREHKEQIKLKSYTLSSLKKFFKIENKSHDALADAEATMMIYDMMKVMFPVFSAEQLKYSGMSNIEKRAVYLSSSHLMVNHDGSVYIHPEGTKNVEALKVILEEIWSTFIERRQ